MNFSFIADCPTKQPSSKARRKQVKRACSTCRAAHAGCDNERPCSRCIAKGLQDSCNEWIPEDGMEEHNASPSYFDFDPPAQLPPNASPRQNILPQKRSRDQICFHGWESDSLLTKIGRVLETNDPLVSVNVHHNHIHPPHPHPHHVTNNNINYGHNNHGINTTNHVNAHMLHTVAHIPPTFNHNNTNIASKIPQANTTTHSTTFDEIYISNYYPSHMGQQKPHSECTECTSVKLASPHPTSMHTNSPSFTNSPSKSNLSPLAQTSPSSTFSASFHTYEQDHSFTVPKNAATPAAISVSSINGDASFVDVPHSVHNNYNHNQTQNDAHLYNRNHTPSRPNSVQDLVHNNSTSINSNDLQNTSELVVKKEQQQQQQQQDDAKTDLQRDEALQLMKEEVSALRKSNQKLEKLVHKTLKMQKSSTQKTDEKMKEIPSIVSLDIDFHHSPIQSQSITETQPTGVQSKKRMKLSIPTLPRNLPLHVLSYSTVESDSTTHNVNEWYQFGNSNKEVMPISCWIVRKDGRADNWTLLECNRAFLDLIGIPVAQVSSCFSLTDLVPQRFKSTTCELLQKIIHSDASTAKAKSIWTQKGNEMCVCTSYRVYRVAKDKKDSHDDHEHHYHTDDAHSVEVDERAIHTYRNGVQAPCETGCGAYRTQCTTNNKKSVEAPSCADQASISVSSRDADRIIWTEHQKVETFDDYVQIGDDIHEQTFSISAADILPLVTNAASSNLLRTRRNRQSKVN